MASARNSEETGRLETIPRTPGLVGLTAVEVSQRIAAGETNAVVANSDRSYRQIVAANVFTRFNAILGVLVVIIVSLGPAFDGLFALILVANMAIGIVQEVRAKRTLDRLTLLSAATVPTLRDGRQVDLDSAQVVRSDIVGLRPGAQIPADGIVVEALGLEVDESLLTGESEPEPKSVNDEVRSGSFVTAGTGWFRAERVGQDAYANQLTAQARRFHPVDSEIRAATDRILRLVTWAIGPIALALLIGQKVGGSSWKDSVFGAASGVVEIVPEGFVLLTSMALAMSIVRLGRSGVLVKELAAVEGLARVNVICFDKTGTLTDGTPALEAVEPVGTIDGGELRKVLRALTEGSANATSLAIRASLGAESDPPVVDQHVPFSSVRKWSAATIGDVTWFLGAAEYVFVGPEQPPSVPPVLERVAAETARGRRVLVMARSDQPMIDQQLPQQLEPVAVITMTERLRPRTEETLQYFADQNVGVKVISGDSPVTVASIARSAGMQGLDRPGASLDAGKLSDPAALADALHDALVVGRSSPHQKQQMVEILQRAGDSVAMTGDGVNDTLALKAADLAIAMVSGSEASRAVAQIVLVRGDFSALPGLVAEGRRVIATVERVAKLFVTKTIYAIVLALATGVARVPFPFLPRQLTLVSLLTIGAPGFFLAFAPEAPRTRPGFFARILVFSLPAGTVAAGATFAAYSMTLAQPGVTVAEARSCATVVLGLIGLWIVSVLSRPMTRWRGVLLTAMAVGGMISGVNASLRRFWVLDYPTPAVLGEALVIAGIACVVVEVGWRIGGRLHLTEALHG